MRLRHRRLGGAVVVGTVLVVLLPGVGVAFTGTPAAIAVVRAQRVAYSRLPAVGWVLAGDVVYCPDYAEGWTFAPHAGCQLDARVSEQDVLSGGRVVRLEGTVSAPSRPTVRYVVSVAGWYRAAVGATCWQSYPQPYVDPLFVSYPFPGQTVSILSTSKAEIVSQALTPKYGLRELDYIDPKTYLEPREVVYTTVGRKTYRVAYTFTFPAAAARSIATPNCG
jgi:hypothetical protein